MITHILKIKNLGRLNIPTNDVNDNTSDDFSFKKNTLIFGDNTYWKTTLSSVFKALQSWENLEHRKSFWSTNPIQIKIKSQSDSGVIVHEYWTRTWKSDDIIIFDNDFIKNHIFSEDQIKGDHLKSLPTILIGNNIKRDIENINRIIKCDDWGCWICEFCLGDSLKTHKNTFNKDYQLDLFMGIKTQVWDIDKQIKDEEEKLALNENLTNLKLKIPESNFYKLDFQEIENTFNKRIVNTFESVIETHLSKNINNIQNAYGFLELGLTLRKGDICPFCSQDTNDVKDFIENLSNYFDEEYKKFKTNIEDYAQKINSFDLGKELLFFQSLNISSIQDLINEDVFNNALTNVKRKIIQKQSDLNFECDFAEDADFILLKNIFSKAKILLNWLILKTPLTTYEIQQIGKKLSELKINKYRYSAEGINFYWKYQRINDALMAKKEEKELAQKKLQEDVDTTFKQSITNINSFLESLRADFKIIALTPSIDNRNKNDYLKVNEYKFQFVDVHWWLNPVMVEQFKETFSDSDKRLLGFAFFLSILRNDSDLSNKIVILDDPFSSFDINRKEETIKLFDAIISIYGDIPKQKIVFTHEKNFYCQLNRLINPTNKGDKKLLRLNFSRANKWTMFEAVNIKKFEADKYYSDLEYIHHAFIENTNLDEALPKARECLEYLLKAKYIGTLESYRDTNGNPINFEIVSVSSFLTAIGVKCSVKSWLENLELHRFHHSQPQWKRDLTDTQKNQILWDFINLIEQV